MKRALENFLRRVRSDPLLAQSLRRAPAQTLDRIRGLDARERSWLIDRARAGALPRVFADIVPPGFFQAYPLTYSVRRDRELKICIGSADGKDVEWKIVQVTGFSQGFQDPDGDTPPWSSSSWQNTTPWPVNELAWNRDEVGYGWPATFTKKVPSSALLGLYALKLKSPNGVRAVYFVVRKGLGEFPSAIVLHWPWSTMCAYSGSWDAFKNLYDSYQARRLGRVSRDRPFFDVGIFNGNSADKFVLTHQAPLNIWRFVNVDMQMEIDSCTSFDLNDDPDPLNGCQLFISAGHDEYWSVEMRDRVEELVEGGGNAAFFSANVAWWQVRFEGPAGHIMACHKSAIDDPVAGQRPDQATGNWASTGRPENTLTGVSFKRGTMGTVDQVEIRNLSDPFLDGVTVPRFPANPKHAFDQNSNDLGGIPGTCFSTVETDGADYDEQTLKVTGLDGSPRNFKVLATTEILGNPPVSTLSSTLGPHGRGTVGYFSRANGGTVFTGATTDWGLLLDDDTVKQITKNVIKTLAKKQAPGQDWDLLPPKFPSTPAKPWDEIRVVPRGLAILGVMQGQLLLYDTSNDPAPATVPSFKTAGNFWATDAEDPRRPWTKTMLPAVPPFPFGTLGGYASNLYGTVIFAADNQGSTNPVWTMTAPVATRSNAGWSQSSAFAHGNCFAIAATWGDIFFTITRPLDSKTPFLFAGNREGATTRKLGRTLPPILAMTALDGKLFGVGNDGTIYCRETCVDKGIAAVDLVWSPICKAPVPTGLTYSITGYLGRLYALAGPLEPTAPLPETFLPASTSWSDSGIGVPIPKPSGIGEAEPSVPKANVPAPRMPFARTLYWRTATSDFGSITPHMLFCKSLTSPTRVEYALGQLQGNGYFRTTGGDTLLDVYATHVARVARDMALFYNNASGEGWVYQFAADGSANQVGYSDQYDDSWRRIVYVHEANSDAPERVLFYDGEKVGTIGRYLPDQNGHMRFVADDWRNDFNQWDQVTATWSGRLLFYDSVMGAVAWGHLDKHGKYVDDGELQLPDEYKEYDQIVPAGNEYVVFSQHSTGAIVLARVDSAGFNVVGRIPADSELVGKYSFPSAIGLILFYNRLSGVARAAGFYDPEKGLAKYETLYDYETGDFAQGWDQVAALGILS